MQAEEEADYQREQCTIAARLYAKSMSPPAMAAAWFEASSIAATSVQNTLKKSEALADIANALEDSGAHMLVLRQMLAPPLSQDQFAIVCPAYNKGLENKDRPVPAAKADIVAEAFLAMRDIRLLPWLSENRHPTAEELQHVVTAVTPLLASQLHLTAKRTASSAVQEEAVVDLLNAKNWERLPSRLVDRGAILAAGQFMKKTKFATTTRPQEVDIACGLGATMVLAMECKVSNDTTNSVKRINDVLKKATAWRDHWGSFVRPAALLQGTIGFKDVQRLIHAGVTVFWSHDLPRFERWIDDNTTH